MVIEVFNLFNRILVTMVILMNEEKNKKEGYTQIKVTIKELHAGRETSEPSEKALRARANDDILVPIGSSGNKFYFDKMLSVIRVVAARRCKMPGTKWSDIRRIMKRLDSSLNQSIIERLNNGHSKQDIIDSLAELLLSEKTHSDI